MPMVTGEKTTVIDDASQENEDLESTEEGTEEGTEEEGSTYEPPTEEAWRRMQRENKRRADQLVKLKRELAEKGSGKSADEAETAKAAAVKEVEDKYKARIVKAQASAELVKMGLKGDPKRLVKLLSLDDIDVEDDDIIGLDSQLEDLKADYPDLFDNRKVKSDKRLSGDASDKTAPPKKESDVSKLMAQLGIKK